MHDFTGFSYIKKELIKLYISKLYQINGATSLIFGGEWTQLFLSKKQFSTVQQASFLEVNGHLIKPLGAISSLKVQQASFLEVNGHIEQNDCGNREYRCNKPHFWR